MLPSRRHSAEAQTDFDSRVECSAGPIARIRMLAETDACQGLTVRPIIIFHKNCPNAEHAGCPDPRVHDQELNGATPRIAERKSVEPVEARKKWIPLVF